MLLGEEMLCGTGDEMIISGNNMCQSTTSALAWLAGIENRSVIRAYAAVCMLEAR